MKNKPNSICDYCKIKFYKRPCLIKRSKNHFCSIECHNNWQKENPTTGRQNPHWKRIPVICLNCEKIRYKWPSSVKKYKSHFCSDKCKWIYQKEKGINVGENNPAWRGGYDHYYGHNWQKQRKRARRRDNFTCQKCNKKESEFQTELHVHHIIPFRDFNGDWFAANQLDNLISLCQVCHINVEWQNGILERRKTKYEPRNLSLY